MSQHRQIVRPTLILWGVMATAIAASIFAAGLGSMFIYQTLQVWSQLGPWLEPLLSGIILWLIAVYLVALVRYCWRLLGKIEARHLVIAADRDAEHL